MLVAIMFRMNGISRLSTWMCGAIGSDLHQVSRASPRDAPPTFKFSITVLVPIINGFLNFSITLIRCKERLIPEFIGQIQYDRHR